jgi:hypothetical protein
MAFTPRAIAAAEVRQDRKDGLGPMCAKCGGYTFHKGSNARLRVPINKGGKWSTDNCVILCNECFCEIGQDSFEEITHSTLPYFEVPPIKRYRYPQR